MAKLIIAVAVLLFLFGAAFLFRTPSTPPVAGLATDPSFSAAVATPPVGPDGARPPDHDMPAAVPAAKSGGAAAASSGFAASAADRGAASTVPATTTYVGPDGKTYDIPPPSAELVALGDNNLRAAVMDEIRSDPEAFAKAMRVELEDVQRVANGESELPPQWIVQ